MADDQLAKSSRAYNFGQNANKLHARPEGSMEPWENVYSLGGSSLLLGAVAIAPSKALAAHYS